ncbi:MAG: type VI secretion protein VasK, partial [Hafnia sp.]
MKNKMSGLSVKAILIILILTIAIAFSWMIFSNGHGKGDQYDFIIAALSVFLSIIVILLVYSIFQNKTKITAKRYEKNGENKQTKANCFSSVITHLRARHGLLWRNKIRILLVVGENAAAEAIAPGLTTQQWLEGQGT